MKKSARTTLIAVAVAGTVMGMTAGWFLWGGAPETGTAPVPGPVVRALSRAPMVTDPARAGGEDSGLHGRGHSVVLVAEELQKLNRLSAQEFARELLALENQRNNKNNTDPDKHLRYGLYMSQCTSERAMAVAEEYQRRGQGPEHFGLFFVTAGKIDGKNLAQRMLEAATPETKYQWGFNSVMHGWAAAQPREVVAWLNSMPDSAPYRAAALQGAMWGLAETSPAIALEFFNQLSDEDRYAHTNPGISAADSLGRSTVNNHGFQAYRELLDGISDQAARDKVLAFSYRDALNAPPADFVQYMAGAMESAPDLWAGYEHMAARWVTAEPDAAMKWLAESAQRPGQDAALKIVSAQLANGTGRNALAAWLSANPRAPGSAAIAAGKSKGPPGGPP